MQKGQGSGKKDSDESMQEYYDLDPSQVCADPDYFSSTNFLDNNNKRDQEPQKDGDAEMHEDAEPKQQAVQHEEKD